MRENRSYGLRKGERPKKPFSTLQGAAFFGILASNGGLFLLGDGFIGRNNRNWEVIGEL
jgi:hypothetical protein